MSLPRIVTGVPGPDVGVISQPVGRPATVLLPGGGIVSGFVPPLGMALGESQHVHRGPEVRAALVNKSGAVVVDEDGVWRKGPSPGGGWQFVSVESGAEWRVRYVVALAVEVMP